MEISPEVQQKLEQIAKLPIAVRASALVGIGLLLGVCFYFTSYSSSQDELAGLRSRELELQRKLSEVRSVASNIAAFEEEITQLEIKLTKVLRQLPNKQELEVLLTDISNLGKTAGIEIKSFRRKKERGHEFYAEVPIALALEGTYHDIARFFDMLSGLPRIVNMSSLSIGVAEESIEETRLRVTGIATTFRFLGAESMRKKKA